MSAKKLWGTIAVVIGVGLAGYGIYLLIQIHDASSQMQQLGTLFGTDAKMMKGMMQGFGVDQAINSVRIRAFLILTFGVLCSIGGTYLLKTSNK